MAENKQMVTVYAVGNYVRGGTHSVTDGQPILVTSAEADELVKAGMASKTQKAPETKEPVGPMRIVSDAMPDPDDITAEERLRTDDPRTGRKGIDPSMQRKVVDGDTVVVKPSEVDDEKFTGDGRPDEGTTDREDDGKAARGSFTTGEKDVSKGPKPASKPVKTGQGNVTRQPIATGKGKVADRDKPESQDPDGLGAPDPIETVDTKEPTVETPGPRNDPAAGTEGQEGPSDKHPSPGTTAEPKAP